MPTKNYTCAQRKIAYTLDQGSDNWNKGSFFECDGKLYSIGDKYEIQNIWPSCLFSERIEEELQVEAEMAADLIKEKAEGRPHSAPMEERKSWADLIRG